MNQPKVYSRLFVLFLLLPLPALAQTGLQATVAVLVGKASAHAGEDAFRPLHPQDQVHEGDWVQLETQKSKVILKVSDGTEIRLKGRTRVHFVSLRQETAGSTKRIQVALLWGKFWAKVVKLASMESKFEVKAGGVICGVRGTVLGGSYDPEGKRGSFYNFEGHVYVDEGQGPRDLPEGYHDDFTGGHLGKPKGNGAGDPSKLGGPGENAPGAAEDLADLLGDLGGGSRDDGQQMLVDEGHLGILLGFTVPEGGL